MGFFNSLNFEKFRLLFLDPSKIFTRLCWEMGYVVKKHKENLIPVVGEDPRVLPYLKKLPFNLMELPLSRGVGLRFYPLSINTFHPFILALINKETGLDSKVHAFQILKKYSELVNVRNANDFLGFSREEGIFPQDSHPYEFTFPWSTKSPGEMKKNYIGYYSIENRKYGLNSDECLESVYVSTEKIQLEATRLINLLYSITNNGYVGKEIDPIGGAVFVKGEEWKWFVEGGQHRAAVVTAMGMEKVLVHVKRFVRREDVNIWPGVKTGIYSPHSALKLFDHMFEHKAPSSAKAWVDYVNKDLR